MKITFLGTGAADWNRELHKDMEGFRRNSSCLIDDVFLIDPGPDVFDALEAFGKSPDRIKYIINTHNHSDHYSKETVDRLTDATFYPLNEGEVITVGKYTVEALEANHATVEKPVHFIISDGEHSLFYGMDGAWLTYSEVAAIKKNGVSVAVIDATVGDTPGDFRIFEHNDLNMVREIKHSLKNYVGRWIINHMARTLHTSHAELVENMARDGIEVAYDGMETEI